MKEITNRDDYKNEFESHRIKQKLTSQNGTVRIDEIDQKLCEIALETRKFEIDLYWKRTTYYWAFSAAIIAAYALVYTKEDPGAGSYTLLSVLALCGVVFSLGWYLANRDSKYWQENWEDHIAQQITRHYGPIFKILKCPEHKPICGIGGFPYSVSKINQLTSGFMFVVWSLLWAASLYKVTGFDFSCIETKVWLRCIIAGLFLITGIAVLRYLYKKSWSKHYTDYLDYKKGITKGKKDSPMFYTYD